MLRTILFVGLLLSGLPALVSAYDPEVAKGANGTVHTLKREQRDRVASIAFNKELGLGFDSLETLGARIDQARKSSDPVGLANAANELTIAEKVSGKKAKLTSSELWKESIDLAELRGSSAELKAISQMLSDEAVAKKLAKQAAVAEKREDERRTAIASGEQQKGISGYSQVVNNTNELVTVYVNGFMAGSLFPGQNGTSFVGLPIGTTVISAQGSLGGFWTKNVSQIVQNDLWVLTE
jgi:hypothetical protein